MPTFKCSVLAKIKLSHLSITKWRINQGYGTNLFFFALIGVCISYDIFVYINLYTKGRIQKGPNLHKWDKKKRCNFQRTCKRGNAPLTALQSKYSLGAPTLFAHK